MILFSGYMISIKRGKPVSRYYSIPSDQNFEPVMLMQRYSFIEEIYFVYILMGVVFQMVQNFLLVIMNISSKMPLQGK
jgi:hypothetical protein